MNRLAVVRRFAAILLLALWWGGFTFYALAVVPTGHQVLRSKVRQGFITQQVTNKLNALGGVTLGVLLWELLATRRSRSGGRRFQWAVLSWALLAATLAALCWLHGRLDAQLDFAGRTVLDDGVFYQWHRAYLIVATIQWLGMVVHFASLLDRLESRRETPDASGL